MRPVIATLMRLTVLLLAGASAGCSDAEMRESGREIEQSIAQRWETWRRQVSDETKANAQRQAPRPHTRAQAPAPAGREPAPPLDLRPVPSSRPVVFDKAGLAEIVAIAEHQRAQSLTVKLRGKTVLDKHWGRQDELHAMMQMTYPIVALTMGQLVAERRIPSLDTPLGRWLPAFRQGQKGRITVRDVMTGRDRLKGPEPWPAGLYRQPNYLGFYAGSEMEYEGSVPGQGQVLPNESVVLLGAVVKAAAGMPLDRWVATRLFEPLGIQKSRWRKDKAGNIDVWAGLWLPPSGALKIGELVLNEGRWNGRQVLPRAWVIEATSPAARSDDPIRVEDHGYGWTVGREWVSSEPKDAWVAHRRYGIVAGDYIGNHLIVHPTKQIVAFHAVPWDGQPITRSIATFEFDDLLKKLDEAAE